VKTKIIKINLRPSQHWKQTNVKKWPKKYQNLLELILKTRNPSHELETNPIKGKPEKNIHEAKFLINKTLRGGIEEKKDSIKKRNKKNSNQNNDDQIWHKNKLKPNVERLNLKNN